jgi:TRAP-type uncharacterized transport system substrate-binding protein
MRKESIALLGDEKNNEEIDARFLSLGDDAAKVKWYRLDRDHKLYASHESIIQKVIRQHGAYQYWEAKNSSN